MNRRRLILLVVLAAAPLGRTLAQQPLEPGAQARDLLAGTRLAAMPGFGGQLGDGSESINAVWTPDGAGVAFAATTNRNDAAFAEVTVLVAGWQSAVSPPEIVRIDPATGRTSPLTRFNVERAAGIDWQPVRHFWFTSSRGAHIHNMLVVPAAFDSTRRYPLFVVIHGGAANMWTDQFVIRWNYHLLGAPGYVVLLTDYTGSTGYGEAFAQAIQNDPLNGPGRDVLEGVDEVLRRFTFVDSTRMVAGGASYGGHLTNWLAANTTRFRALVSHAGLWDLESQWGTSDYVYGREVAMGGLPWVNGERWRAQSPLQKAANLHTPVLVSVGERDFRVPMNNALEFWAALQRMRVPSRLLVWPEENHWIMRGEDSRYFYREVHGWIARWLGEGGAPAGR